MFKKKVVSSKVAVKKVVSKKNKKALAKKKVVSKKEPKIASLSSGCVVVVSKNLPKNKKSKKSVNTITWKIGSHKFTAELVNVKREY